MRTVIVIRGEHLRSREKYEVFVGPAGRRRPVVAVRPLIVVGGGRAVAEAGERQAEGFGDAGSVLPSESRIDVRMARPDYFQPLLPGRHPLAGFRRLAHGCVSGEVLLAGKFAFEELRDVAFRIGFDARAVVERANCPSGRVDPEVLFLQGLRPELEDFLDGLRRGHPRRHGS